MKGGFPKKEKGVFCINIQLMVSPLTGFVIIHNGQKKKVVQRMLGLLPRAFTKEKWALPSRKYLARSTVRFSSIHICTLLHFWDAKAAEIMYQLCCSA